MRTSHSLRKLAQQQKIEPVDGLDQIGALWPVNDDPDRLLAHILNERAARRTIAREGQAGPRRHRRATPLHLNTATITQLKQLPGIGDTYAARIIRGRPYRRIDEMVQKNILPPSIYKKIKEMIVAR